MNEGLFKKYEEVIKKSKTEKSDICQYIQETTGIHLNENEITIDKKRIIFNCSSAKKLVLKIKGVDSLLFQKGYTKEY